MELQLSHALLRPFQAGDEASLAVHANDRGIWENLRDRFPYPYAQVHAEQFIGSVAGVMPPRNLAIVVSDEVVGGLGFELHDDVERIGAELGYWLGRRHWGRGIVTDAVRAATPWALETFALERVFALPFVRNVASCRVLEKAGFVREGVLRRSAVKDGEVHDQVLFAFVPGAGDALR